MSCSRIISFILILVFFDFKDVLLFISCQEVPSSPCPDVFIYDTLPNGDTYGRITIPHDGKTTLNLGVNASMKGYYTDKRKVSLKIKMNTPGQDLIEQQAKTISYSVTFPFQHAIPKITNIELNNKRFCSGPPEILVPGTPGVTSMWAGHTFYFQTEGSQGKPLDPDENIGQSASPNERPNQRFDNIVEPVNSGSNQNQQCGVPRITSVQLIVGGADISDGMLPWLTAIFVSHGAGYEYKCTGNLVSDKHVITAARCLFYHKVQVVQTTEILFLFGKTNLKNWATSGAVTRGASKIQAHPDFDQTSGHADIVIVTLDRPLTFSSTVSPICLGSENDDIVNLGESKGTVAGWGADKSIRKPGQYSTFIAKSLEMPIVPQDECLNFNLTYYSLTSDITFCAGQRDGTGTCIGDVGAGFMVNKQGKYYLKGLASIPLVNKKGECDLSFFMIFCDVAKLTDWITTTMKNY